MSFITLIRKYYYFIGVHHRILRDDNLDDNDAMKRDDDVVVVVNNGNGCHATPAATKQEWWNIGGPNTILPQWMESFLCWSLALSCLSISGYHYIIDNYIRTTNNKMTITTTTTNNNRIMTTRLYRNVVLLGLQDYILHPIRRLFLIPSLRRRPIDTTTSNHIVLTSPESQHPSHPQQSHPQQLLQFPCWIPLMTFSRAELQRGTPYERYIQLIQVLEHIHPTCLLLCQVQNNHNNNNNNNNNNKNSNETIIVKYHSDTMMVQCCTTLSDNEFILLIRQNEIIRRLVSLALRPSINDDDNMNVRQLPIGQQCIRIWSQLLTLPPIQQQQLCPIQRRMMDYDNPNSSDSSSSTALDDADVNRPITTTTTTKQQQQLVIALIIPCYQETTNDIIDKLNDALHHCSIPQRVQVRLVMAGKKKKKKNTIMMDQIHELQLALLLPNKVHSNEKNHHIWGDIQIIEFLEESGRGPCLNYGATYDERPTTGNQKNHHSNNNILVYTFCHSDTRLPYHWDETLIQTLYPSPPPSTSLSNHHKRINACAYRFGIDTSTLNKKNRRSYPPATHHNDATNVNDYYPPGIHAIEVTANLRCTFWSLPYGDQCISMRANDFHYIGGFPHQCLMEDYELVTLLRKRMKLLPLFHRHDHHHPSNCSSDIVQQQEEEVLQILSGPPVLCSPRRWQKFGVFYVTYTNSRLVQLYNQKNKNHPNVMTSPEDIYQLYYGQRLDVIAPKSPWEIELEHILKNKAK